MIKVWVNLPHLILKNIISQLVKSGNFQVHCGQEWQYGTVRSEFADYVPRTLNRTAPAFRTSVQILKRTVPTYRTRTNTKKAYRTSVQYFFAKIEAYLTVLTYSIVLPSFL